MGYFAQQALDILRPDLTIEEQLQEDSPQESIGVLRNLAGAFGFSGPAFLHQGDAHRRAAAPGVHA